jgi:hypothetical protein
MFKPPTYDEIEAEQLAERQAEELEKQKELQEDEGDWGDKPPTFDNPNPRVNDLDRKDKKIACESLVDTVLSGYEGLHTYAQQFLQVSDEDMTRMQMEGKIDLSEFIPLADGKVINISTFVNNYNHQCFDALEFDSAFKEKVRPAMVRVFMKKGWGLTDEQFLLYAFGQDILTKVGMVVQLKATMNASMKRFEEAHQEKHGGLTPKQSVAPSYSAPPRNDDEFDDVDMSNDEGLREMEDEDMVSDAEIEAEEKLDFGGETLELPEDNPLSVKPPKAKDRPANVKIKNKRK